MSAYTSLGPGDEATWPPYSGNPNDPRAPDHDEDDEPEITANCPFCGGPGEMKDLDIMFVVECRDCGAAGPFDSTENDAAEAWNRRKR